MTTPPRARIDNTGDSNPISFESARAPHSPAACLYHDEPRYTRPVRRLATAPGAETLSWGHVY